MQSNVDGWSFADAAAAAGLGEIVGRYRSPIGADVFITVAAAGLGVVLLLASGGAGGAVALGVGVLALAGLAAWTTWRKAGRCRYLYTGGSLAVDHTGAVTSLFTWDDVAHVRVWVRVVNLVTAYVEVLQCRVELKDGTVVDLAKPGYKDKPELVAHVERYVAAALLPVKAAEALRTGAAVFGPVTVTGEGVRRGEQFAAWPAVTKVETGKTHLRIWAGDRRPVISERLRDIPDVAVLLHLLQHWPVAGEDDADGAAA
ncbi:DUF6585 family protein [Catellatospora bangladeshensis]|uniref:Uncharacterized protein n=1 Tax=Catellatospora bangladeshensis TaxID=310355 RepID=A0A8J3NNE9_9ACTN|nr:DUF6585 family protein [Catellatospora bangladeshensis]GIF84800.1 hypothetical protein Cba03nite_61490 [Catellatospora bangladeshensis]